MCTGLAEPRRRSELAPANQCLKFCDDTPFTATLPTLNNWRDLDLDCLAASFLVQWNAGKRQFGVNSVPPLRPAGTRTRCSRYGKLPTVNLVRVAYVLTVINTIYFSTWLHKHKLCLIKFWNSDRNRNALREMFSCLQQSLGRHQASLFDLDMLNFVQTNRMIILVLLYFEWKLSKTRASLSNTMQFWVIDDLCKLGKEYLTALKCKLCTSF